MEWVLVANKGVDFVRESVSRILVWGVYSSISLLLSIWLAWHALAQANFLYPVWYSLLDIEQTVETFAPKNQFKPQFQFTEPGEHKRLFAEIVSAVQNNGDGLLNIYYLDQQGKPIEKFLTAEEVTHLQDVANLIHYLNRFSLLLMIACLLLLAGIYLFQVIMPSMKKIMLSVLACVIIVSLVVVLLGAQDVFYWLHTKIFPAEHQWFFYYEESLMSTLMKAPVLFAPISLLLILCGIVIWCVHLLLLKKLALFK